MKRPSLAVTLVRHGQSVSNTEKRFGSQQDVALSDFGREQARQTAAVLKGMQVTRVVASDLSRASETARAIAEAAGVPLETHLALRERDVGTLTGLTFEEAQARFPDMYADLVSGDPARKIGGAESYQDVAGRVDAFLDPILETTEGHLVVVSHMVVLTHLLRRACGIRESTLRGAVTFTIENTSLHRLNYERQPKNHWHVRALNDTRHLKNQF